MAIDTSRPVGNILESRQRKMQSSLRSRDHRAHQMGTSTTAATTGRIGEAKASLFTIAQELRDIIYQYALTEDEPIIIGTKDKSHFGTKRRVEPGLLAVCKQIRREVTPTFYGNNIFELARTHGAWTFLAQLGPERIGYLKLLRLSTAGGRYTTSNTWQIERVNEFAQDFHQFGLRPEVISVMACSGGWTAVLDLKGCRLIEAFGGHWSLEMG